MIAPEVANAREEAEQPPPEIARTVRVASPSLQGVVRFVLIVVACALSLGFVVGFFDLIPLVGATLGAIVVSFASLTVDFPTATIVWIAFVIVWQRFEDYVVQPLVYGKALRVNPIATIVSVLVGASLLGILGALLAIPTAAAIQIVLRDWWAHRTRDSTSSTTAGA
jgi:predicted PurR-regulated permease PerM